MSFSKYVQTSFQSPIPKTPQKYVIMYLQGTPFSQSLGAVVPNLCTGDPIPTAKRLKPCWLTQFLLGLDMANYNHLGHTKRCIMYLENSRMPKKLRYSWIFNRGMVMYIIFETSQIQTTLFFAFILHHIC